MEQTQIQDDISIKAGYDYPKKYKVVFYNDDFTTMEFVVEVLKSIFFKSDEEADAIMMQVHRNGRAEVGTYSYDIAISKIEQTIELSRKEGYPLRVVCEQA